MNELTTIDGYCKVSQTSLTFKRDVTKKEWQQVFNACNHIEGCIQFWIGDLLKYRDQKWGMYEDVAEETGIPLKTLKDYKYVADSVKESERTDNLSWSHHQKAASLEPEKQKEFLEKAVEDKLTVRELANEIKEEKRKEQFSKEVEIPNDIFSVLYVDPPWSYNDKCESGAIQSGGADKHYPTMSIQEMIYMDKPKIDDNAVLFMWVTSPLLEEGFELINGWGFKYKTSFIWDKVKHNMGHYNSVRHELLLICTKGSKTPENIKLFDSVQTIEKTKKHSEKPPEFGNIINTLYPSSKKVEMFCRDKKDFHDDKWTIWGNEV